MQNLNEDIKKAEMQFNALNCMLSTPTSIDHDKTAHILNMFDEMNSFRTQMLSQYPRTDLQKFNKNFVILIKQIQDKLDNIIKIKESEKRVLSDELHNLSLKRKLSIYNR